MKITRIGSSGASWLPDDMTGTGASCFPGRWNKKGDKVIYAAKTLALAVLETAAHIDDTGLPLNKYVVSIDIPSDVWSQRKIVNAKNLPGGWDSIPHGMASINEGAAWYASGKQALIELPSVIVPEEKILLINATHPDAKLITARVTRRFQYNLLFRPSH